MSDTPISTRPNHILLTGLGERAQSTLYTLGEQTAMAALTPLALTQLLSKSDQPGRVLAMVTRRARETTWPLLNSGIRDIVGFDPEPIDIPDGRSTDEVRTIMEAVAEQIPEGAEVTLDITQGFRHFPFLLYALGIYLQSLRNVQIRAMYNGMVEGFS